MLAQALTDRLLLDLPRLHEPVNVSVWKDSLFLGLTVCVNETMTVEELGHDVGPETHVERGACLLTLK